jgi:hypothetical protein
MTVPIFFAVNATVIAVMAYNQYSNGVVSVEDVTTTVDATSNVVSGLLTDTGTNTASASQPSFDDIRSSSEEKDNF